MAFESPIEALMGKILNELRIPYQSQLEVGEQRFGGQCKSWHPCEYKESGYTDHHQYAEDPRCELDGIQLDGSECSWCTPISVYPLYRLDFAIAVGEKQIAIECDGFDYHKRTEQQIQADIQRDQWLRTHDWIVKHYSGTFITRYSKRVKHDIQELIARLTPSKEPDQRLLF